MNKSLWNSKFPPNAFIFSVGYKWAGSGIASFLPCWKVQGSLHTTHRSDKQCSHEPAAIYSSDPISHIFASVTEQGHFPGPDGSEHIHLPIPGEGCHCGMQSSVSAQTITWDEQHGMSLVAQVQHTHTSELPTWAGEGGEKGGGRILKDE